MQNNKNDILLYMHAGSGNHGCEAIVSTVVKLLNKGSSGLMPGSGTINKAGRVVVASVDPDEDRRYSLDRLENEGLCELVAERHIAEHKLAHILLYGYRKITGDKESFLRYRFKYALDRVCAADTENDTGKEKLAISVGGDNYCYPELHSDLKLTDSVLRKHGLRTMLLGCSIEPDYIPQLSEDLKTFDRIIARESITYNALRNSNGGIIPERISLCPDPAFLLEPEQTILPDGFISGGTVGVNLSPMVRDQYGDSQMVMENYVNLIKMILSETDMSVALIPHVVKSNGDDRRVHAQLAERFTDEPRLIVVDDRSAAELKYIIGKCAYFIGARTHATIAAYSSLVPTLVLGYSVKSKGIARDLFGDEGKELVLPVKDLKHADELANAFCGLTERGSELRKHLAGVMPDYLSRAEGIRLAIS